MTTLPYGPTMTRLLPTIQRAFLLVNRYAAVPLIRTGLGPLLSTPVAGPIMVLRTKGRRSGLWRDAPLGYVIADGCIYCVAGMGPEAHWFRNLQADPAVEVLLPSLAVTGEAVEVIDPGERIRVMRVLMRSLGLAATLTLGDVRHARDAELDAMTRGLPLVRIRMTGLANGPFDSGGWGWTVPTLVTGLWVARAIAGRLRRGPRDRRR